MDRRAVRHSPPMVFDKLVAELAKGRAIEKILRK